MVTATGIDITTHIPVGAYFDRFMARMADLDRSAHRLGLDPFAVEVLEEAPRPVRVTRLVSDGTNLQRVTQDENRLCKVIRITHPAPAIKLEGWEYAGYVAAKTAVKDTSTGNVAAPSYTPFSGDHRHDQEVLNHAFNAKGMMRCDHCNRFRNRRIGLVVRNRETGEHRVVGSTCCKDYLGHDPERTIQYFQKINLLDYEFRQEANRGWYQIEERDLEAERRAQARRDGVVYPLRNVVAASLLAIRRQGFYSQYSGQDRTATWELALDILTRSRAIDLDDLNWSRVDAAIDWSRTYIGAGQAAVFKAADANGGLVPIGLVKRTPFLDDLMVRWSQASGSVLVGRYYADKDTAEVEWEETKTGTNDFGDYRERYFVDGSGTRLIWKTNSDTGFRFEKDKVYRLSFRIKKQYAVGRGVRAVNEIKNVRVLETREKPHPVIA